MAGNEASGVRRLKTAGAKPASVGSPEISFSVLTADLMASVLPSSVAPGPIRGVVTVKGKYFLQEDSPVEVGEVIAVSVATRKSALMAMKSPH